MLPVMIRRLLASDYCVLVLSALLVAALGPTTPGLLSGGNLLNLVGAMLPLAILAAGQTVVLVGGGIDLSATSIVAFTSVAGAKVMSEPDGWLAGHALAVPAAVLVMLGFGAVAGWVNGFCITRWRMPPFMVTLTSMMFLSGWAVLSTESKNIAGLPSTFLAIGQRLPLALGVACLFVGAAYLGLRRGLAGRWLQAYGFNARTAEVSGVPIRTVVTASYVLSGLAAATGAILLTARLETGSPVMGQTMMLDVVGAAVIGGTSLFGGRGSVAWTLNGAFFLTLMDNMLSLRGIPHHQIMVIKGMVILAAAGLDVLRRHHRAL